MQFVLRPFIITWTLQEILDEAAITEQAIHTSEYSEYIKRMYLRQSVLKKSAWSPPEDQFRAIHLTMSTRYRHL